MTVLLLYATNSGGTQRATEIVAEALTTAGHVVTRKFAREVNPDEIGPFDLVILASPSWDYESREKGRLEGQPHIEMRGFLEKAQGKTFPDKKFAILGLGDTSYMYFTGAVDHLEKFVVAVGGKRVLDSLRIDGFYFDQENNEKRIHDWAEQLSAALSLS